MFSGVRFVTNGVMDKVPPAVQQYLWYLIDKLKGKVEQDYLQVFELSRNSNGGQKLIHQQEMPPYWSEYVFDNVDSPLTVKVYVIDDGPYSTMLLPEER